MYYNSKLVACGPPYLISRFVVKFRRNMAPDLKTLHYYQMYNNRAEFIFSTLTPITNRVTTLKTNYPELRIRVKVKQIDREFKRIPIGGKK
jgi:hypothetical protein